MQDLTVTLVQSPLHWESTAANLAMFEEKLWQIGQPTDLIILPEMFTTGFSTVNSNVADLAEPMNFTTYKWMKQQAAQHKAAVMGSVIIKEDGHCYNRLLFFTPDGECAYYDKRHLFRMAGEHNAFTAGKDRLVVEWKGWRICPMVCYDLRFPVYSRNSANAQGVFDYDLLVYVANWPAPRVNAWDTLLEARAIENLSYSIGVNRTGSDGDGRDYLGHSAFIDFKGNALGRYTAETAIETQTLNYANLQDFRQKFPTHLDADDFTLNH